jgi:hypothetical protein
MNIQLTFSQAELQIIGVALGAMPFRDVVQLIDNINKQVAEQTAPKLETE